MKHSIRVMRRPRPARPPAARTVAATFAVVALALLAAGCGGGSSPGKGSPSSTASSTGSGGSSNAGGSSSGELVAFAQCMRSHGVPNFPDPQAGATNAKFPSAQQLGVSNSQYQAGENACEHLLPAGNGDEFPAAEIPLIVAGMRRFSQCVRAHGVSNWPDPTVDSQGRPGFNLVGISNLNEDSPQVQSVLNGCQHLIPSQVGGIPVSR